MIWQYTIETWQVYVKDSGKRIFINLIEKIVEQGMLK